LAMGYLRFRIVEWRRTEGSRSANLTSLIAAVDDLTATPFCSFAREKCLIATEVTELARCHCGSRVNVEPGKGGHSACC